MASLDQLKLTFFDECSEALQQIEAGLTEMQDGTSTDDTINAIFRSVHSVKGGAGIFGFEGLVNFAHVSRPCSIPCATASCRRRTKRDHGRAVASQ